MKHFLFILLATAFTSAHATIDGPSCGDLTKSQDALLRKAARNYVLSQPGISGKARSVKAFNADCHDYDGVHSGSDITVDWIQVDADQEMACSQELGVSVDYDQQKKLKTIDRNSNFYVEENGDVECEN